MSPRMTASVRFVIVACFLALTPLVAYAQACPQPVVVSDPDVCAGSYGSAAVEPPPPGTNYVTFEWSIVNGSLPNGNTSSSVTFFASGEGDVELTAAVTDDNACQSSSTVTIPLASIPPPQIDLYEPSVCPGSDAMGGYASIAPPPDGIEYESYEWSIVNGTIDYGNGSSSVSFSIDGSAPAELSVTVIDIRGCQASSTVTVPVRTIPPPQINLYEPSVCPGSNSMGGYASVAPPPDGITYQTYEWSIVNGTITYGQNNSGASFTIDGSAPAVVSVTVRDSYGCVSSNSVSVPVRTIPPPQINLYEPSVCPGSSSTGGYASVAPPPDGITYQTYEWSIVNGTITYGQNNSGVSFTIDGSAPAVVSVTVRDSYGCVSSNSATVAIRTIPPPEVSLYEPGICPGPTGNYASVTPPPAGIEYQTYEWSIVNGTITYGEASSSASFTADGTGPVQLTVTVRDSYGCVASKTVTVPLGAPPPITIERPNDCSTQMNRASIEPGYTGITWSVTGATILSGQGTAQIEFAGDGSGSMSVSVTATRDDGCAGTSTVAIPASVTPIPFYAVPESACPGSLQKIVAETVWGQNSFNWTITNATVEGPTDSHELRFRADGTGPVTASVTAREWLGCPTSNSITIPLGPMPEFTLLSDYTEVCPGGFANVYLSHPPGDVYGAYQWNVTNGYVDGDYGSTIWFKQSGSGPVTVTLTVGEGSCARTSSIVIPVRSATEPIVELGSPTVCEQGVGTIYFDNASSFNDVRVYASNADVWGGGPGRVAGGTMYNYRPTGGPVQLNVYADSNSCTLLRTLTPTVIPTTPATISASGPTSFCEGGSVTLTASAGTSYVWSTGATTQSITVAQTAMYWVDVTDGNGCARRAYRGVNVNPLPGNTITASGPTTFCSGGSVTLTAPSGQTYAWSNGANTRTINVTASGTFSVTVTSPYGCTRTSDPVTVTVHPYPAGGIQSAQVYDDNGGSGTVTRNGDDIQACGNPTVRLVPAALDPSYSYNWSTGATTAVLDVTSTGTYTVTVTGAGGCATTSSVNVTYGAIPAKPVVTATGTELCPAGGSVTLNAPAADGWTWSTGETTQSIVVTQPGSYTVRVRNGACESALSDEVVVTTGVSTITTTDSLALCGPGSSATLTADGGTSWLWSNGETTQSIVVTEAGTYTVTTTNAGCTMPESDPVVVTARTATIDAGGPLTFCEGDSVTLTANGGTSWLWSNGATTQSITVAASGSYGVTATFDDGCAIAATPVDVEARQVTATVVADRTTVCTGDAIQLTASASGGSGYSYQWYDNTYTAIPGATSPALTIHPTASGFVYVKVVDDAGCEATSSGTVYTVMATPDATITTASSLCEGQSGSASVADAGAGATYEWTITNGTLNFPNASSVTFTPSGLDPVTLSVTITNAGCSVSSSRTVTIDPLPTPSIGASGPTTFCEGESVTLTGQGGSGTWYRDGAVYSGASSIAVTAVGSATFVYRITTAAGCTADSAPVTVTVNPKAVITSTSGFSSVCWSESSAWQQVNSPPAGATFVWTVTDGTLLSGANDARVYYRPAAGATSVGLDVTMTTAEGCSTSRHFDIPVDRQTPSISASGPTTFCTGGSVTLTMPTAPAGWTYQWSNSATTQSIDVSSSGTYTAYYRKSAGGCLGPASEPVTVTVNAMPTASISASGATTFCEGGSVTLTASEGASYLWSNGATSPSISVSDSGSYSVTVTSASGCSATSAATNVTVHALPAATISASGATTFCEGGSVTLTASEGASYLWSNGATSPSISVSDAGDYTVTVTNASGCSATSSATTVTVNAAATPAITASGDTTFCEGGSVTLTASAGSAYLWSTGATSPSIEVTSSGSYTVTVTDANGCSATSEATAVTVNAPATPSITASGDTTFCEGGSVTLTASAGVAYLWSTGATTQSIEVSSGGSYSVTVADANGCSATSEATTVSVNTPATPAITASGDTTFCQGGSVTLTASPGASYLWSTGAITPSIEVSSSGSYSVTVTDANGCSATSEATTVTVDSAATPTISESGPTTFCQGGSVTLTASTGASYLWSTGQIAQSIEVTSSGNYSVTVTDANGCSATSAPTAVTVNALPAATITPSGPVTFCEGGSVILTASAGASYLWSTGEITPSIEVTSSGNYSVTVTNANGCSATSAPTTVTENAKPATPTVTASGPTTFCAGGSVTLSAPAGFSSYLWSTGAIAPSINVSASGTYSVTVTDANGCSATSAGTAVMVNPTTAIAAQPQNQTIARNTTTSLSVTATGTAPLSYQWYRGTSPSTANPILGATSSSYTTPQLKRGTYTYWVRVTGGCGAVNSTTATVSVP